MDINCVSQCYYQHDGKCTLDEIDFNVSSANPAHSAGRINNETSVSASARSVVPVFSQSIFNQSALGTYDTDCPYFTGGPEAAAFNDIFPRY